MRPTQIRELKMKIQVYFEMFRNWNTRSTIISIVLSFFLLIVGCQTVWAQSWVTKNLIKQNALKNAENVENIIIMNSDIPLEQHAYLIPKEYPVHLSSWASSSQGEIINLGHFDLHKIAMIPPGHYLFSVTYGDWSQTMTINSDFEAGKYYTFDYKFTDNGKKIATQHYVSISIIEVTDEAIIAKAKKDLALVNNYLAYSKANPNAIEGTYKTKEGKQQKTITFKGNKFHLSLSGASYDGTFRFNEKTIIFRPEVKQTSKRQEDLTNNDREIWYYKLDEGTLDIERLSGEGNLINPLPLAYINSKFYKTTDSENLENGKVSLAEPETLNEINAIEDKKVDTVSAPLESLEGTYKTKDGKKQITFTGNRFQISVPVPLLRQHQIFDGTFIYDGKTITLNNEFVKSEKGKAAKRNAEVVLSYQINDGLLDIFDIKKGKFTDFLGQYYKSSE